MAVVSNHLSVMQVRDHLRFGAKAKQINRSATLISDLLDEEAGRFEAAGRISPVHFLSLSFSRRVLRSIPRISAARVRLPSTLARTFPDIFAFHFS